jgi:hypothetical protein
MPHSVIQNVTLLFQFKTSETKAAIKTEQPGSKLIVEVCCWFPVTVLYQSDLIPQFTFLLF